MNIHQALQKGKLLLEIDCPTPTIDSELLLCFSLKKPRSFLYSHPEYELNQDEEKSFLSYLERRFKGEPIAYIIGKKDFWTITLEVNANTLIPRPETELLVEISLNLLSAKKEGTILDLGTGSGAIALSLAIEKPNWKIIATDIDDKTLECAKKNSRNLNITNIEFVHSNWFTKFNQEKFDAIITNPPYLAQTDIHLQQGDLRFEPKNALISGKSGLEDINLIIEDSIKYLKNNGLLLIEHGFNQRKKITQKLEEFNFVNIVSIKDLQGHYRISGGWYKKFKENCKNKL